MTDLRKAAEMALDAMLSEYSTGGENKYSPWDVIEALRQALAQPEQQPVAWMWKDGTVTTDPDYADGSWTKLYTAPPKREWVGLTDDEIEDTWGNTPMMLNARDGGARRVFARAIEAKLKEKNT